MQHIVESPGLVGRGKMTIKRALWGDLEVDVSSDFSPRREALADTLPFKC